MGREIRRVPKDWVHPSEPLNDYQMDNFYHRYHKPDSFGYGRNFQALYDKDFDTAAKDWLEGWELWREGKHEAQLKYGDKGQTFREYCEWEGRSPDPELYREQIWTEAEATCFQIYETVSEGTPVSPVFETLDQLADWLIEQGTSPEAARAFAKEGWAPSMVIGPKGIESNYDTLTAYPAKKDGEQAEG